MGESEIIIPLSKRKIWFMLVGSLVFVALGFWIIINWPNIRNPFLNNPTVLLIAAILSVLLFGFGFFYLLKKIRDTSPGLVINETGVIDNSSALSVELILWSDVLELKPIQILSEKFIMFIVQNPQAYINRQANVIKRKTMQMNYDIYGSPINISCNALEIAHDDLFRILHERLENFKSARA